MSASTEHLYRFLVIASHRARRYADTLLSELDLTTPQTAVLLILETTWVQPNDSSPITSR